MVTIFSILWPLMALASEKEEARGDLDLSNPDQARLWVLTLFLIGDIEPAITIMGWGWLTVVLFDIIERCSCSNCSRQCSNCDRYEIIQKISHITDSHRYRQFVNASVGEPVLTHGIPIYRFNSGATLERLTKRVHFSEEERSMGFSRLSRCGEHLDRVSNHKAIYSYRTKENLPMATLCVELAELTTNEFIHFTLSTGREKTSEAWRRPCPMPDGLPKDELTLWFDEVGKTTHGYDIARVEDFAATARTFVTLTPEKRDRVQKKLDAEFGTIEEMVAKWKEQDVLCDANVEAAHNGEEELNEYNYLEHVNGVLSKFISEYKLGRVQLRQEPDGRRYIYIEGMFFSGTEEEIIRGITERITKNANKMEYLPSEYEFIKEDIDTTEEERGEFWLQGHRSFEKRGLRLIELLQAEGLGISILEKSCGYYSVFIDNYEIRDDILFSDPEPNTDFNLLEEGAWSQRTHEMDLLDLLVQLAIVRIGKPKRKSRKSPGTAYRSCGFELAIRRVLLEVWWKLMSGMLSRC
jgi:hypothetical protein